MACAKAGLRACGGTSQAETEQQPDAWVHNATEEEIVLGDTRLLIGKVISSHRPPSSRRSTWHFFGA
jgi:hypothetical protein